jgi:putative transposase
VQLKAKAHLHDIWQAETRAAASAAFDFFAEAYGVKWDKAVAKLVKDRDALLTFYDFPAEHWKHIRTSNPIESSFATVRLRQRVTKGPGSRKRGLMMAYKLLRMAEQRWRRLDGFELLPLVRAGVQFRDGVQLEREDQECMEREAA